MNTNRDREAKLPKFHPSISLLLIPAIRAFKTVSIIVAAEVTRRKRLDPPVTPPPRVDGYEQDFVIRIYLSSFVV
jgi:hypothetical protein